MNSKRVLLFLVLILLSLFLFGCTTSNSQNQDKPKILFVNALSSENVGILNSSGFESVVQQAPCDKSIDLNKYSIVVLNGNLVGDSSCITNYFVAGGKVIIIQSPLAERMGLIDCTNRNEGPSNCDNSMKTSISGTLWFSIAEHPINVGNNIPIRQVTVLPVQLQAGVRSVAYIQDPTTSLTSLAIAERTSGEGKILYFNYDPFMTPQVMENALVYLKK